MKMRKIMAAGVAATLAVTSLAAVASAETLTFSMKQSTGTIQLSNSFGLVYGKDADVNADFTTAGVTANKSIITIKAQKAYNYDGKYSAYANDLTLTVKGLKIVDDDNSVEATETYTLKQYRQNKNKENQGAVPTYDAVKGGLWTADSWDYKDGSDAYYVLIANQTEGEIGEFVAAQWARIDSLKLDTAASYETNDEAFYGTDDWKKNLGDAFTTTDGTGLLADELEKIVDKMTALNKSNQYLSEKYAMLEMTTANENDTIRRGDVDVLSGTRGWGSVNVGGVGTAGTNIDNGNQSYITATGLGDGANQFAGLASQVADFFNHKTNGSITMKFTTPAATNSGWVNGGVPSTQIGLRADLEANNFAFYVNWQSSTGALEAVTSVDKNSGTVTFDISEILADLGGQTKGVITDLAYGLNQGIKYAWPYDKTGLLVEEITLAYEDDAAEEEDIVEEEEVVEEEEEVEEEVVEEEEEEEVEIEEEEEVVEEEEEEEVDGEMFEEEETEEEDVNPGTGVALAVVPAMIAAAAAVVSKKRK